MNARFAVWLLAASAVAADTGHGFGPLPPTPLPAVIVTTQEGRPVPLPELVRGKAVAVQFIFTSCSTACPLLGSLFRSVEKRLARSGDDRMLLSISVDPDRDSPEGLKAWLKRYGAGGRWQAVTANAKDLESILRAFGQKAGQPAAHTTQVFYVSKNGDVIGRSTSLPDPAGLAAVIERLP